MSDDMIPEASHVKYVEPPKFDSFVDIKIEPDENEVKCEEFDSEPPSYNGYLVDTETETRLNLDEDSMDVDSDDCDWTDSGDSDQSASEDDYVLPEYTLNWDEDPKNLKSMVFTETPGLKHRVPDAAKPIDYFYMLADDSFFDLLVSQTNSHAEYLLLEKGEGSIAEWKMVTKEELKIFFGLLLHMGTIQCHKVHDYWKTHRLFGMQCFRQYMGRNRFSLIMKCLHFSGSPEPQEPQPSDKLHKVKAVIDFFNDKMEAVYVPQKQLSIDDFIILYHRKLIFSQGYKNMKRQYGVKLYMLTESTGVILSFAVVHGEANPSEVALQLIQKKLNKGYSLYMGSAYTSYTLAKQLLDAHTYSSGVLGTKHNIPLDLQETKLKHGESSCRYANAVLIGKWRTHREVYYISTEHDNVMVKTQDKKGERRTRPKPVAECFKYLPGKDFQEQVLSYYPSTTKPHGWDKQVGLHIVLMMLYNSHLLYKKNERSKISFYDFRLAVVEEILPEVNASHSIIVQDHLPKKCPKKTPGKTMRRRCKQCWAKGERKDTLYYCRDCPGAPGLCLEPCFGEFHNKMNDLYKK